MRRQKKILGENHPDTLMALNNLASSYSELGYQEKALELKQEAYEKQKEILGENHPDALLALNNLASSYGELGYHEKALELNQKVYEKRKRNTRRKSSKCIISIK